MTVTLRKHLLFMVGKGFLDPEVLLGSSFVLAVSAEGLLTPTLGVILMESNYSRQRTLANLITLVNLAMLKGRVTQLLRGLKLIQEKVLNTTNKRLHAGH